jgi:VanZ family protein
MVRISRLRWPWLPAVAWMLAIYAVSYVPGTGGGGSPLEFIGKYQLDKLIHVGVFGFLCWLWLRALHTHGQFALPRAGLFAILITVLYGAFDEWQQQYMPGRCSSVSDWLADTVGAFGASRVFSWYDKKRRRQTD